MSEYLGKSSTLHGGAEYCRLCVQKHRCLLTMGIVSSLVTYMSGLQSFIRVNEGNISEEMLCTSMVVTFHMSGVICVD